MLNPKTDMEKLPLDFPINKSIQLYSKRLMVIGLIVLFNFIIILLSYIFRKLTPLEIYLSITLTLSLPTTFFFAYQAFRTKFHNKIHLTKYIWLIKTKALEKPTIIAGCEIINLSIKPVVIDHLLLMLEFEDGTVITFFPEHVAENAQDMFYKVRDHLETFREIKVLGHSSITLYFDFSSYITLSSLPPGMHELKLRYKIANTKGLRESNDHMRIQIPVEVMQSWIDSSNKETGAINIYSKEERALR